MKWLGARLAGEDPLAPRGGAIGALSSKLDPYPWLVGTHGGSQHLRHRLIMGQDAEGNFLFTEERRNLLILGPPRSNKTAGVLIPLILGCPGPVVSTSTKNDVLRATAQSRGRLGVVWHFTPDGERQAPGTKALRWSPIPPSRNWTTAIALATAFVQTSRKSGKSDSDDTFFAERSASLISALFHAAAVGDKDMAWVLTGIDGNDKIVEQAVDFLAEHQYENPDSALALSTLESMKQIDQRTKTNILASAAVALSVYKQPAALATTKDPNFDPAEFAAGRFEEYNPHRGDRTVDGDAGGLMDAFKKLGSYDTIYITASRQQLVAPLIAGLLSEIRNATFDLHRDDEARGIHRRPPVVWALDELASLPMQDLPETLTQSGGQNLLIAGALQDMGMVERRWDIANQTFLTLFGDIVVLPGLANTETLDAISKIIGKRWQEVVSHTNGIEYERGWIFDKERGRQRSRSTTQQQIDELDSGTISRGLGDHSDRVLHLHGTSWEWAFLMPYYRTAPWPQLLTGSLEFVAHGNPWERRWELPPPQLDMNDKGTMLFEAGGEELVNAYRQALHVARNGRTYRQEHLRERQKIPVLQNHDDTILFEEVDAEGWLVSPAELPLQSLSTALVDMGWTPMSAGASPLPAWTLDFLGVKVAIQWQNPATATSPAAGALPTLESYVSRMGPPEVMLLGRTETTAGVEVLRSTVRLLAALVPAALFMNRGKPLFAGNWKVVGGVPDLSLTSPTVQTEDDDYWG